LPGKLGLLSRPAIEGLFEEALNRRAAERLRGGLEEGLKG
jgi:hypothetical protein